jgi:hypothetical protein
LTTNPDRSAVGRVLPGDDGGDQLDQPLHGRRVEEVQADHLRGARRGPGDLDDGDRGGVRRQDRVRALDHGVELGEQRRLDVLVLGGGLDDQVPVGQVSKVGRVRQVADRDVPVPGRQLPRGHPAVQRGLDASAAGRGGPVVDLADDHV